MEVVEVAGLPRNIQGGSHQGPAELVGMTGGKNITWLGDMWCGEPWDWEGDLVGVTQISAPPLHRLLGAQIFYPDPGLKPLSRGPSWDLWPPKDSLSNPPDPLRSQGKPLLSRPRSPKHYLLISL